MHPRCAAAAGHTKFPPSIGLETGANTRDKSNDCQHAESALSSAGARGWAALSGLETWGRLRRPLPLSTRPGYDREGGSRRANIAELRRIAPDLAPSIAKLTVPAYILDRNATVRWLNAAALARFGDLRGKKITQIVEPAYAARARQEFAAKLLGTQESTEATVTVRAADGTRLGVEISSTQLLSRARSSASSGSPTRPTSSSPPRPTAPT